MYLLDTDHISLLARGRDEGERIRKRLAKLPPTDFAVCIINYEEQMRGWLAEIAASRSVAHQKAKYSDLNRMLRYYCATPILLLDDNALEIFQNLWLSRIRIGTMDLKIAAITMANSVTLLTRNISDFGKIPGLRVEDWSV